MKNLFTFIVALFMATGVYAQKTVTYYSFTDGTKGTSSDGLPSLTFSDGAVLKLSAAMVGNSPKDFASSDKITVDGNKKQTIKLSKGLQTILELPAPATKITLYSFYNDNNVATNALYWEEFAGQTYDENTATTMKCNKADKTNPDAISFNVNYLKRVTFTDNGYKQMCVVIKVEYADENKYSSVTIGKDGFATHASEFAVDYSNRTDGLVAYAVKYAGGKLSYNQIDGIVPAKTAVLLKGEAKDYILGAAEGEAKNVVTDLKPSDGSIKGADKIYCLANKKSNGVGFYRVATGVEIPANKAYLEINAPSSAKYYSIGIGGNTTGIQAIHQNSVKADGIMYSLSGQRVGENYKGIVICNGKKMIKK